MLFNSLWWAEFSVIAVTMDDLSICVVSKLEIKALLLDLSKKNTSIFARCPVFAFAAATKRKLFRF